MTALMPSEAAERLCPQLLAFRDTTAPDEWAGCYCQGPKCQAWRWAPRKGQYDHPPELRRRGYCGLAGRPEADATGDARP